MSNNSVNTASPVPQNVTFEFYFPLPNDSRIYYVTYTELHPLENARLLNDRINLSQIFNHQIPHHNNIQSLIQKQIQQQVQQPVYCQQDSIQQQQHIQQQVQQPVYHQQDSIQQQQQIQQPVYYQQNSIQQQSFDSIQPPKGYSTNNTYDTAASYNMQDMGNMGFQNFYKLVPFSSTHPISVGCNIYNRRLS
jgi:hypothetical protein